MIEEKKTVQDRGIAIALSALMVLSVVAVGAAAITPAAAQTVDEADRSVDSTEVQPGDTVEVTVNVTLEEADSFRVDEGFDPAFSNVEIVDADGASFDAAEDDRAVARYGVLGDDPRQEVSLVYEVTVPDSANAGDTYTISSNDDSDVQLEDTVLTVTEDQGNVDASRTVPSTAQAGDTVEVTVDVDFEQSQSFRIDEGFDPAFSDTAIVDSDSASFSAAENSRVVARYGVLGDDPRGSATLVYEVTIPDDAEVGDTFEISSNADSDVQLGTDEIEVGDSPSAPDVNGDGNPAQDLDGDGLFEDVDGNGEFTVGDVQVFFDNRDADAVQDNAELFNFDGDEPASIGVSDVQVLFQMFQDS